MTAIANLILLILAIPAIGFSVYLLCLTLLSRALLTPLRSSRQLRFDIIVPAHNEAAVITTVVSSLRRLDWPTNRFRILVVADNCTDNTAQVARAAGADVLERYNPQLRGKGYALEFAFQVSMDEAWASAVVVVDADTEVSPNLLEAFAARIEQGAQAAQVHYAVLNVHASWRTRLLSIAMAVFHQVRSRARERMQLSCGVRGNGWCITHQALRQVPYRAYSLTEDIEFGIDLGLAGHRVEYADEAQIACLMVTDEEAARTQRQRWEGGRWQLVRAKIGPLLQAVKKRGDLVCLDLAFDLLVPPLSYVVLNIALLMVFAGLIYTWWPAMQTAQVSLWIGIACGISLVLYVLRGWQLSGVGLRGLLDLLRAPYFVLWKLWLILCMETSGKWVRTKREQS